MSIIHPENQFLDEARLLSISARFGLAMSFLNEFCDRFSIDGLALDQFREHLWACPVYQPNGQDFGKWYEHLPPLAEYGISDAQAYGLKGISSLSDADLSRFKQIVDCTYDLLQISFYGAGEDDKTYELLVRISKLGKPTEFPATTPFKFSSIEERDGWGPALLLSDLQFWRKYSESWFR